MHLEYARRARQALYAPPPQFGGPRPARTGNNRRAKRHTGTTIMALRFAEGVMLAADRQITGYNSSILSDECIKIERITDDSALLSCGLVSSGQIIGDALKVHCRSFEETTGYPLTVKGQLHFACNLSREANAAYGWWEWSFGGILVGKEADDSFAIFSVSDDGAREEPTRFTADGSGFRVARTVLQMRYRDDLTHAHAVRIVLEALYYAGRNDLFTSDVRTTTPTVASVMADGLRFIADADVRTVADDVITTAGRYL